MTIRTPFVRLIIVMAIVACGFFVAMSGKSTDEAITNNQYSVLSLVPINISKNHASYELERVENYREPVISANGVIAVYVDKTNKVNQVLFEKNADKILPIASITKLMTALVALDNYSLDEKITITQKTANQENNNGGLKAGEEFSAKDLLYPMLIGSDNGAAYAFSEEDGTGLFVKKMNDRAKSIGLESTIFSNATGLDPDNPKEEINRSTARNIYLLANYLLDKPLIWEILKTPRINLYSSGNVFHHEVISTNEFLENYPVLWKDRIIGGKTGWTSIADGCLMLVVNTPNGRGVIIAVVLGTDDRFGDMEKLTDWVFTNYR